MNWVLDASMALAWLMPRADAKEAAVASQALASMPAVRVLVPAIWQVEVGNALLRGERAGLIPEAQSAYFLGRLAAMRIETDPEPPGMHLASVMALARMHGRTAYDASYLELAMRRGATLATFDRKLAEAARSAGVPVFGD